MKPLVAFDVDAFEGEEEEPATAAVDGSGCCADDGDRSRLGSILEVLSTKWLSLFINADCHFGCSATKSDVPGAVAGSGDS